MPADSIGSLTIGEDNAIRWNGLYDKLANDGAGAYVNDATISWVIRAAAVDGSFDSAGTPVASGGGTMAYQAGSDGNYYGTIEDDAALTAGATYYVVATATASGDRIGSRKVKYVAGHHGSTA